MSKSNEAVIDMLNKLIQEQDGFELISPTGKISVSKWGEKRKSYVLSFCELNDNKFKQIGTIDDIKLLKKFFGVKNVRK